ncbi:MAG TPA: hypothetical protein ENH53_11425, partial [Bacteroidetes bacterium]|nr:hypothetical protein [Bacteroidota bacterium]
MKRTIEIFIKGVVFALLLSILSVAVSGSSSAKTAKHQKLTLQKPAKTAIWQKREHNVGRLVMPISNYGVFGQHPERIGSG